MLGRPVAEHEYPDEITSLLVEVVDVAQIRGTSDFAAGLQRFLQRSLPLPGRRPYTTADDALIEARDLARVLGVDVCRRAFLEFIEQDSGAGAWGRHQLGGEYGYGFAVDEEPAASPNGDGDDISDPFEVSLDLDLDTPAPGNEAIYDLDPADDFASQDVVAAEEEPEEIFSAPSTVTYDDAEPVEQTLSDYRPAEMSEPPAMVAAPEVTPTPEPEPESEPELAAAFDEDSSQQSWRKCRRSTRIRSTRPATATCRRTKTRRCSHPLPTTWTRTRRDGVASSLDRRARARTSCAPSRGRSRSRQRRARRRCRHQRRHLHLQSLRHRHRHRRQRRPSPWPRLHPVAGSWSPIVRRPSNRRFRIQHPHSCRHLRRRRDRLPSCRPHRRRCR